MMHLLWIVGRVKSCNFGGFDIYLAERIDRSVAPVYFLVALPNPDLVQ